MELFDLLPKHASTNTLTNNETNLSNNARGLSFLISPIVAESDMLLPPPRPLLLTRRCCQRGVAVAAVVVVVEF